MVKFFYFFIFFITKTNQGDESDVPLVGSVYTCALTKYQVFGCFKGQNGQKSVFKLIYNKYKHKPASLFISIYL